MSEQRVMTAGNIESAFENPINMYSLVYGGVFFTGTKAGLTVEATKNKVDAIYAELGTTPQYQVTTGASYMIKGTLTAPNFMTIAMLSDVLQQTAQGGKYMSAQIYKQIKQSPLILIPTDPNATPDDYLIFYNASVNLPGSEFASGPDVRGVEVEFMLSNTQLNGYNGFDASSDDAVASTAFGYFGDFHKRNPNGLPLAMFASVPLVDFNADSVMLHYDNEITKNMQVLPYLIYVFEGEKPVIHEATGQLQSDGKTVIITPKNAVTMTANDRVAIWGSAGLFREKGGVTSYALPVIDASWKGAVAQQSGASIKNGDE